MKVISDPLLLKLSHPDSDSAPIKGTLTTNKYMMPMLTASDTDYRQRTSYKKLC